MRSQLNNPFKHLLSIEHLSSEQLETIFQVADKFIDGNKIINKPLLKGIKVVNLFFEPSTRTIVTFEIAAKSLSADVINLDIKTSSSQKGESLVDMLHNLEMMGIDIYIVRHSHSGLADFFTQHVNDKLSIINAGDGNHAHPTQALLDMATIRRYNKDFKTLKVAIVGDVLHSRVARSQIWALKKLGVSDIRIISPFTLTPDDTDYLGVKHFVNLKEGLEGIDIILTLRLQKERMKGVLIPSEKEFFHSYGITKKLLKYADPNAIILHPGPVNRGVEIESSLLESKQCVILNQVTEGIAIRMAVMVLSRGIELEDIV